MVFEILVLLRAVRASACTHCRSDGASRRVGGAGDRKTKRECSSSTKKSDRSCRCRGGRQSTSTISRVGESVSSASEFQRRGIRATRVRRPIITRTASEVGETVAPCRAAGLRRSIVTPVTRASLSPLPVRSEPRRVLGVRAQGRVHEGASSGTRSSRIAT